MKVSWCFTQDFTIIKGLGAWAFGSTESTVIGFRVKGCVCKVLFSF